MADSNAGTNPTRETSLKALFLDHPRAIGESYGEHAGHALVIGARMIAAGLACLVHALIPGLFVRTASNTVDGIVARMDARASAKTSDQGAALGGATMMEKPSKAY